MPDLPGGIPKPPHAYIPGQTPRHPEDWFDPIKDGVREARTAAELAQTKAFRAGLAYLEAGYFWECHEVLEAVWMQTGQDTAEREMVQALIQLANARLKLRMDRPRAVARLCDMVEAHLDRLPPDDAVLGIAPAQVRAWMTTLRGEI